MFYRVPPLVCNPTTGYLIGGHQRLTLLKQAGRTEVPVVVVSLSPEREKALNVALNNERVAGRWDFDKLQDLLRDLIELPNFDETLTGFSPQDLQALLLTPDPLFEPDPAEPTAETQVVVTLKIATDDWETFRPELDHLLEQTPVEIHVQQPLSSSPGKRKKSAQSS